MRSLSRSFSSSLWRPALGAALAAGLVAAALAAPPETASAAVAPTTFYVNCSARTNGSGTAASPWNSVSAVNRHGGFLPGERILLKRATTCKGQLTPTGSGTTGKPIVLGAYGTGSRPTVAGGGTANNTGAVHLHAHGTDHRGRAPRDDACG